MIGQRLKAARRAAGLSLRSLEARIGGRVSAQAIGKYERDEMMPGSAVLTALADGLDVTDDYLLSQGTLDVEGVEFRTTATVPRKEAVRPEAAVLQWLERYLALEDLLGLRPQQWGSKGGDAYPVAELAMAELAAGSLREAWSLGRDHVLNLAEYLEERGVKVMSCTLPEGVSGMTCWVRTERHGRLPVVVVNQADTGERQRFTLAHELGHMVVAPQDGVNAESAASRFAGAFLMPADIIWTEVGRKRSTLSLGELFVLKPLFGLSVQALTYRCKDLHVIDQTEYARLFRVFKELGWRDPPYEEPNPVPPEHPTRFKRLSFRALAEGVISHDRAAELLGITAGELTLELKGPVAPRG